MQKPVKPSQYVCSLGAGLQKVLGSMNGLWLMSRLKAGEIQSCVQFAIGLPVNLFFD